MDRHSNLSNLTDIAGSTEVQMLFVNAIAGQISGKSSQLIKGKAIKDIPNTLEYDLGARFVENFLIQHKMTKSLYIAHKESGGAIRNELVQRQINKYFNLNLDEPFFPQFVGSCRPHMRPQKYIDVVNSGLNHGKYYGPERSPNPPKNYARKPYEIDDKDHSKHRHHHKHHKHHSRRHSHEQPGDDTDSTLSETPILLSQRFKKDYIPVREKSLPKMTDIIKANNIKDKKSPISVEDVALDKNRSKQSNELQEAKGKNDISKDRHYVDSASGISPEEYENYRVKQIARLIPADRIKPSFRERINRLLRDANITTIGTDPDALRSPTIRDTHIKIPSKLFEPYSVIGPAPNYSLINARAPSMAQMLNLVQERLQELPLSQAQNALTDPLIALALQMAQQQQKSLPSSTKPTSKTGDPTRQPSAKDGRIFNANASQNEKDVSNPMKFPPIHKKNIDKQNTDNEEEEEEEEEEINEGTEKNSLLVSRKFGFDLASIKSQIKAEEEEEDIVEEEEEDVEEEEGE